MPAISTDPRIEKGLVPNNAVRDQAATGAYFEYTYAMCMVDPSAGGQIMLRNVALFAVHNMLFLRRSVGEITLPPNSPATLAGTDVQVNFRTDDKSGVGRPLTEEEAFLTVMRGWEFATQRPQVAHIEVAGPTSYSSNEYISVGAHALISEPMLWPVVEKDIDSVRKGDVPTARRLAKQAEAFWLATGTEREHDDGTFAHRIPKMGAHQLNSELLIGKIATQLIQKEAKDYPAYAGFVSPATDVLPEPLKMAAISETDWS